MRRAVVGYEGLYEVSSDGAVYSLERVAFGKPEIQMKPAISDRGYLTVNLRVGKKMKRCRIHRLVADAFIPNSERRTEVNHLDGDKTNNKVSNLEWSTRSENMIHAIKVLGRKFGRPKKAQQLACIC